MAALHLAARHAITHPWRTVLLTAALTATLAVPLAAARLLAVHESLLRARAEATPLVVGPAGSRFDLAFAALWFRPAELDPVPYSVLQDLEHPDVLLLPLHARASVRLDPERPPTPLVATTPEYLEFRNLRPARGTMPLLAGDAALGAAAAARLGLEVGDRVFTSPLDLYDITLPPTIELTITGVFDQIGTPDDEAIFTPLATAWIVEGLMHGHDDAEAMARTGDARVLAESEGRVAIAPGIVEDQAIRAESLGRLHAHGSLADAPLTAIIVVPDPALPADRRARAATIVAARADADPLRRAIRPARVFDELLGFALRIKQLVDGLSLVLGGCTLALVALVTAMSTRARAAEFRILHDIGAPRRVAATAVATELLLIGVVAAAGAVGIAMAVAAIGGRLLLP
ncbi:MAG: ABC transporter permease [Planctomycetota bacterium]|jgi:putative ABC transport system permease protein